MNYQDFADKTTSEKIILAHVHSVKRAFFFAPDSGLYSKTMPYFVVDVTINSVALISDIKANVDATHYHFEISTNKLYINSYSSSDEIIITYRHFFSNLPINLSWDLQDYSEDVEYLPRISKYPNFKSQASSKKGISISGSGSLSINNNDDALTNLFDKNIFENKSVKIYSFNRELLPSEAKPLFFGVISGKTYSTTSITLNLKDDVYSLSQSISLETFDNLVIEDESDILKRVVYGKVDGLKVQSINQVGNGYQLTGSVSGRIDEEILIGSGTIFLQELSQNDTIIIEGDKVSVDEVLSDTKVRVGKLEKTYHTTSATVVPEKHYYNKNRTFFVANHKIKQPSAEILSITSKNRLVVDNVLDFKPDDIVFIGSESLQIRRISGNTIVLDTNYQLAHNVGDFITKSTISNVTFGGVKFLESDITVSNQINGTTFTISQDAEFNVSDRKIEKTMFRFYSGRNKIWLGSPTFIDITCVAQTQTGHTPISYSLFGKYFIIKDVDGKECGFWFKDNNVEEASLIEKPSAIVTLEATDGNKSYAIKLESRTYTAAEIADIVGASVSDALNCWSYSTSGDVCRLESKEAQSINNGTVGNSGFTYSYTSGVASSSRLKMSDILSSRDFVKALYQSDVDLIEVLDVNEKSATLRSNYAGTTKLDNLVYYNVNYIQDNSIVTCSSLGKENITTPIEAIEDLLNQANISFNQTSFNNAKDKFKQEVSLSIPLESKSTQAPALKDIIQILNNACNGVLYLNNNLELSYDVFDSEIGSLETIKDYDVISWDYADDAFESALTTIANYRHQDYSFVTDTNTSKQTQFTSDFAKKYINSNNTNYLDVYLYEEKATDTIAQRDVFLNGLSSKVVKLKCGLSMSKLTVGSKVYVDLKRHKGVGFIQSLSNNGQVVDIDVVDFGNLIKTCGRIQDNTANEYSLATSEELKVGSYIVENNGIIVDEDDFGTNLIS